MTTDAHLWAIAYDDVTRAAEVRNEIVELGWVERFLQLLDLAVAVRHPDGSYTVDRESFPGKANILACGTVGALTGLVAGVPLMGAIVGAVIGGIGTASAASIGIEEEFIREVEALMLPGSSVLFILDDDGRMDVVLFRIRGLGGTVLKTNVDLQRLKLIQGTLSESSTEPIQPSR